MRGLYAIVDTRALRARGLHPVAFATAVLAARPAALQLRAKDSSPREFLALLRAISPICREAGVPFVATLAPALFGEDDEGYGQVLGEGAVPPGKEHDARLAAANCPEHAITASEES